MMFPESNIWKSENINIWKPIFLGSLTSDQKGALSEYFDKNKAFLQQEPEMKLSGKDSASGQTNGVLKLLDMSTYLM